jgi:predicted porin
MKKLLAVLLLAMAGTSQAALLSADPYKIEIKGNIDAGILFADHLGAANKSGSIFLNSPMKTSRFTIRGTETLDQGLLDDDVLKLGFHLEQQILPGDGSQGVSASKNESNTAFGLAAYMFIDDKKLGMLSVGRQDSIMYKGHKYLDVRSGFNFGAINSLWTDSSAFGGTSTAKTGINSLNGANQVSNALVYTTPTFYGVKASGMWVPGGVAGNDTASSKYAGTITADDVIPNLGLLAGYYWSNNSSGVETARTSMFGANYTWDKWKFAAGYIKMENPSLADGAANSEFNIKTLTAKYSVSDKLWLSGGVYRLEDDANSANKTTQYSLVADYALSKSVTVYSGWARMANEGGFGFTPYGTGQFNYNSLSGTYTSKVTVTGQDQDALVFGMNVTF